ncbi:MAG: thioredoxin-disulfide reductase [Lachnospiraceae bacterium]|nr:thioredoxin-disulfide reductase [Lachnospiraceae bacterium]MEE1343118.1 thioredoxin-disulfide reductase [Lachnospiraceae bacterium]
MEKQYDLAIIGSGPAGLSAAVYAKRAMLDTVVIEKEPFSGGQIVNTYEVDNYLGIPQVNGYDLAVKFEEHAKRLGAQFVEGTVSSIEVGEKEKKLILNNKEITAKAIIVAAGAEHRKLGVKGEEEFMGLGVSYCATCDGAFFREKTVAVVGGGDVALEDALFLARGCKKVYLIHRRDEFRGAKILQEQVKKQSNIEILYHTIVTEITGEEQVRGAEVETVTNKEKSHLSLDGIFVAVGTKPQTEPYKGLLSMDEGGYIIADETGVTNIPGIFVAGDSRKKQLRQIITAAADGANCVTSVEKYLTNEN